MATPQRRSASPPPTTRCRGATSTRASRSCRRSYRRSCRPRSSSCPRREGRCRARSSRAPRMHATAATSCLEPATRGVHASDASLLRLPALAPRARSLSTDQCQWSVRTLKPSQSSSPFLCPPPPPPPPLSRLFGVSIAPLSASAGRRVRAVHVHLYVPLFASPHRLDPTLHPRRPPGAPPGGLSLAARRSLLSRLSAALVFSFPPTRCIACGCVFIRRLQSST
mmetsp:Transcript_35048/g.104546  ORF Transcript_35048/g.104546 Transcript_35048/m.104546 type:complete len:224 (+) Transcript_35048:1478-2149(+)